MSIVSWAQVCHSDSAKSALFCRSMMERLMALGQATVGNVWWGEMWRGEKPWKSCADRVRPGILDIEGAKELILHV